MTERGNDRSITNHDRSSIPRLQLSYEPNHDDRNEVIVPLDYAVTEARLKAEAEYQKAIHESIFGSSIEDDLDVSTNGYSKYSDSLAEKDHASNRRIKLADLRNVHVSLQTANGVIPRVPLFLLAKTCDTIFTLIQSKFWHPIDSSLNTIDRTDFTNDCGDRCISLIQFELISVKTFVDIAVFKILPVQDIPDDLVVECCKVAHYLQCSQVFDPLIHILEKSIDSKNCVAICMLADQLQVSSLFERCIVFITSMLDSIEEHEMWKDFPSILQSHILKMQNAMKSSIFGHGPHVRMFFHSSAEFLALLADMIRDQKERLRDAQERQDEIILSRRNRPESQRNEVDYDDVKDAAIKIAKQEERIKTLERFYMEQSNIFTI